MKEKCIFILICWCLIVSSMVEGQQVVSGRITDATDGTPVPNATIILANSTIGTSSDIDGNYSITYHGIGSFEIGVSHVSYQPMFHKIDMPKPMHQIHFSMEIKELEEVVVVANNNYRRSDVNFFWRRLLGVRPSRNGMEVINPEKVYFFRNSENVLHASCQEPINIINHDLGYRISYILKSFQHDYRKNETIFIGMTNFEELVPENNRQQSAWEKKRQDVYEISIIRFMRALYQDKIHENGFLLIEKDSAWISTTPFPLTEILQVNQDHVTADIETPLYLACLTHPVTDRMIQSTWQIIFGDRSNFPIMILMPQKITVYADGTYTGNLYIQEYRNSVIGLSFILPIEYDTKYSSSYTTELKK